MHLLGLDVQQELSEARLANSFLQEELAAARQRLVEQEGASNARILEIKTLLDAERVSKQEAIAKLQNELMGVTQQLQAERAAATAMQSELRKQLSTKEELYTEMSNQAGKRHAALQEELEEVHNSLRQKTRDYASLCQEHESVGSQISVLKRDIDARRSLHDAALQEHEASLQDLKATMEENKESDRKLLEFTKAEHERATEALRHESLAERLELQQKHQEQLHEIAAGKDGALEKTYATHRQEMQQHLRQYELRVNALEDELSIERATIEQKDVALAALREQIASERKAASSREQTLRIQLTDVQHANHRLTEEKEAIEKRIPEIILEAETVQTSLRKQLAEKERIAGDLKAEIVTTQDQIPPLVDAHKSREAEWQAELADTKARAAERVDGLETEMHSLSQQLEDVTRAHWNVVQERKLLAEKLDLAEKERNSLIVRLENEKVVSLNELEGQLYSTRQLQSMTQNELRELEHQLRASIADAEQRADNAWEAHRLAEKSSSRLLARKDREIEIIADEQQEARSVALTAKAEADRLRSDLRSIIAHDVKVEKNSEELAGAVQELQAELAHQADVLETASKITALKLKQQQGMILKETHEREKNANDRMEQSEMEKEILTIKMQVAQDNANYARNELADLQKQLSY